MSAMTSNNANGDSPHFQMDLLSLDAADENGDSPLAPRIRVSRRARRLAVRVYPDARVEVVVPPRVRPREVEQFLVAHREWINEKRARALRNRPVPEAFPPAQIRLDLSGETWRIHLAGGAGALRVTEAEAGEGVGILRVSGAPHPARLRNALRAWLLRAARERLEPRVAARAAAMGVPFSRVSIRRQRSRWGSCSVRGTISL